MDNRIYFPQTTVPSTTTSKVKPQEKSSPTGAFQQILDQKLTTELKFSQHAQERLKARNIELGSEAMEQLQGAVSKARAKGARESLVLMGDLALVVSVKNNTVITAVDGDSMRDNVFTNIDSAVII